MRWKSLFQVPRLALLPAMVLGCPPARPNTQPVPNAHPRVLPAPPPSPSRVVGYTRTYTIRRAADSVGTLTLELRVSPDSVVNTITVTGGSVRQRVVAVFDPLSLGVREVRDSNTSERVTLSYSADRVRGTVVNRDSFGAFDTVLVDQAIESLTVDRRNLFAIVPWLPLISGRAYALWIYDTALQSAYPLHVNVAERERIPVRADTVDAYRLVVTAPSAEQPMFPTWLWLRADSTRTLLRIERPRLGLTYELTQWPSAAFPIDGPHDAER